jgi:hypothetical protein
MRTRWWTGTALLTTVIGTLAIDRIAGPSATLNVTFDTVLAIGVAALIRRWLRELGDRLTDTSEERRQLQDEKAQCHAAAAANNAMRERLRTEAADVQQAAEQKIAEAEVSTRREFEETRAQELCEAYFAGAMNEREGRHTPDTEGTKADLIILSERRRTVPRETARGTGTTITP